MQWSWLLSNEQWPHRIPCILFDHQRYFSDHMLYTFLESENYFQSIEIIKFMRKKTLIFCQVLCAICWKLLRMVIYFQLICMIIIYGLILYKLFKYYSSYNFLVGAIDSAALCLIIIKTFSTLIGLIFALGILLLTYYLHLIDLNRLVERNYQLSAKNRSRNLITIKLLLRHFRAEHLKIAISAYKLNGKFVSPIAAFGMSANLISNIYLISSLVAFDLSVTSIIINISVIALQMYSLFIMSSPLILFIDKLYSTSNCIFKYQQFFGRLGRNRMSIYPMRRGEIIAEKWALHGYYEVMHTKERINFSVGPMGHFSRESILEVRNLKLILWYWQYFFIIDIFSVLTILFGKFDIFSQVISPKNEVTLISYDYLISIVILSSLNSFRKN